MKKQEKVEELMSRGVTEEEAWKLVEYGQDDYLTIEELKIKYNNPNMCNGYPDWLTETEHLKMCYKTVSDYYKPLHLNLFYTPEELAHELYIYTKIKLNHFNSHQHLKVGMINRCRNLYRANNRRTTLQDTSDKVDETNTYKTKKRNKYILSYDALIENERSSTSEYEKSTTFESTLTKPNTNANKSEVLMTIREIKNKKIRNLLIVCAYILTDMYELKDDFNKVINELDESTRERILNVCSKQKENEIIDAMRSEGQVISKRRSVVSFKTIVGAFGTLYFKSKNEIDKPNLEDTIQYLHRYISYNIFDESNYNW